MPEGLNLEAQLAFLSLRHLAAAFRLKMVSQEQAAEEKRKILGEYQRREEAEAFRRQVDDYHVKLTQATERAKAACLKDPTPENLRRLVRIMDGWIAPQIKAPADRETVAMILYRSGFEVREKKVKEGGRTVAYLEYRKAGAE